MLEEKRERVLPSELKRAYDMGFYDGMKTERERAIWRRKKAIAKAAAPYTDITTNYELFKKYMPEEGRKAVEEAMARKEGKK